MSKVNAQRLERQLLILKELRELNLIDPKATFEYTCYPDDDYLKEADRIAEDQIKLNLRYGCGEWIGNYEQFTRFCLMVRQLGKLAHAQPTS